MAVKPPYRKWRNSRHFGHQFKQNSEFFAVLAVNALNSPCHSSSIKKTSQMGCKASLSQCLRLRFPILTASYCTRKSHSDLIGQLANRPFFLARIVQTAFLKFAASYAEQLSFRLIDRCTGFLWRCFSKCNGSLRKEILSALAVIVAVVPIV